MTSEQAFNKVPEHGWTCFHCGEHFAPTFGGQQAARHHFGESPIEQPACTIDARAFRAMQDLCARYQSEDTELHREIQRLQADHAVALRREEEKGYARGVQDARAMPPVEPSAVEVQEKTMAIGSGFSTPPCMLSPCRCGRDCVPQSSPDERGIVEPIKVGSTLFGAGVRLRTVLDRITRGFNYADNPLPAVPIEPEKASERCQATWQFVSGGPIVPCTLPAGHEGKHLAPEPFSENGSPVISENNDGR